MSSASPVPETFDLDGAGVTNTRSDAKVDAGEPDTTLVSYANALRRST